jgi:hypothetical protein
MEARKQRIADMVKELLPCIDQCQRKQRISNIIITVSIIFYISIGGFILRDISRPIDSNEYAILSRMIDLRAQESHTSTHAVTTDLMMQFRIEQLQDLKGRKWSDALKYLTAHR